MYLSSNSIFLSQTGPPRQTLKGSPVSLPPSVALSLFSPVINSMPLRQLVRRGAAFLRDSLSDGGLLQALRSELAYELSLSSSRPPVPTQSRQVGSLVSGGFTLEWDDPRTQDVVLRRWHGEAGEKEEIAVSAVLGPLLFEGEDVPVLPRDALMKVCLKKPGSHPVLHFDCRVFYRQQEQVEGGDGSDFAINSAYYRPSMDFSRLNKYMGPSFSSLDPQLQQALKDYLVARGIGVELTSFLLCHLHAKEQFQYVNWLQTLEVVVGKDA